MYALNAFPWIWTSCHFLGSELVGICIWCANFCSEKGRFENLLIRLGTQRTQILSIQYIYILKLIFLYQVLSSSITLQYKIDYNSRVFPTTIHQVFFFFLISVVAWKPGKGKEGKEIREEERKVTSHVRTWRVTCVILKGRPDKKILASSKLKEGCMRHHNATTSLYVVTSITLVKYIFFPEFFYPISI